MHSVKFRKKTPLHCANDIKRNDVWLPFYGQVENYRSQNIKCNCDA